MTAARPPEIPSDHSRRDRACCGCLVAVAVAWASGSLFVQRCSNPPEMVTVTFRTLPNGAEYVYFVADRPGGIVRLPSYEILGGLAGPEPLPIDDESSRRDAQVNSLPLVIHVGWPGARRYGVLIRNRDASWRLRWLDGDSMVGPSLTRHIFGGGRAVVRIPGASTGEVPPRDLLDRLGLTRLHAGSDRPPPDVPR